MLHDDVVKLDWGNLLSATVDELFYSSCDDDVSVLVLLALVSGAEETSFGERFLICFRVVKVSRRDVLAADADLSFGALRNLVT